MIQLGSLDHSRFLPNSFEMAEYDRNTIASGITEDILVNRAGRTCCDSILSLVKEDLLRETIILCGSGNNGADGCVIGKELVNQGKSNVTLVLSSADRYSDGLKSALSKYVSNGGKAFSYPDSCLSLQPLSESNLRGVLENSTLVIDALVGIGQRGPLRGSVKNIVEIAADIRKPFRVAIDIPSGVSSDTGQVFEPAFKADLTLSIELVKRGMVQFPARSYCGDIFPVPIGLECKQESEYVLLYQNSFPPLRREIDAHKGKFGRVFVIGGSDCYPGAAILASHSALRVGSGLVALSVLQNVAYPLLWPEIIRVPVMGNERQYTRDSIKGLEDEVHKCSCLVIGPGVGTGRSVRCFVFELLELTNSLGVPTVIDADGINLIAEAILNNELSANLSQTVLTPHPGEASRLLNMTTSDVQMDRYSACRRIHESTGSVCVLKGAASIVYGYGKGYVCTCSNPYLATGGSGDVLSGIIAGLIAQGDYLLEAAARGVFIHAQAGEIASSAHSSPIIASDIIDSIPLAIGNNKQIVIAS